VAKSKYLLIASTEAYSGKSATIIGLTNLLLKQQIAIAYGKPLETCLDSNANARTECDNDAEFLADTLGLSIDRVKSPLMYLDNDTISRRLKGEDTQDYSQALREYINDIQGDLVLLEGPGSLWEGSSFKLSAPEIAETIDCQILLISRYNSLLSVASLLAAKKFLGDRLLGVAINDIPPKEMETARSLILNYLEQQNIPVLGLLPRDRLLNSISVREIANRLHAKVLCRRDRLNLMVESLSIGAMNVNSALEFFRRRENMAVVTGSDRTELQLAALETSTHCLILTGHTPPQSLIINRAEDLEVPVLSVNSDTLTTVEIIDRSFGKVPIHESIKVERIRSLMSQHFDIERTIDYLGLKPALSA
jgi:BioD-like phosphotransacetylase family protein